MRLRVLPLIEFERSGLSGALGNLIQAEVREVSAIEVGVFGRLAKLDAALKPGDRVEIYRAITCDPQTVPRRDGFGGEEDA